MIVLTDFFWDIFHIMKPYAESNLGILLDEVNH